MKALGLEDLRADESECVHGGGLKLAAPFPAAKACVPAWDERLKTVATATSAKVFMLYRSDAILRTLGCRAAACLCTTPKILRREDLLCKLRKPQKNPGSAWVR
jgi:hypothetical protein